MNQRAHSGLAWIALCTIWVAFSSAARAASTDVEAVLELQALEIAGQVDGRVAEVLPLIDGLGGKLLALRSYLRSGERLAERWSWSQEQIAAYEGSPEQQELQAEIERVRQAFAQTSPGYELFVNPQVRSLDIQLANWNRNESVAAASARLLADARAHVAVRARARLRGRRRFSPRSSSHTRRSQSRPWRRRACPRMARCEPSISRSIRTDRSLPGRIHARSMQPGSRAAGRETGCCGAAGEQQVRRTARFPAGAWHYTFTPVAVASQ